MDLLEEKSPVIDANGSIVHDINTAQKGAPRGSYRCYECDYPALKKKYPLCDHKFYWAHYPGHPAGVTHGKPTKMHDAISRALAMRCGGQTEVNYPNSKRKADAGDGHAIFYEVVVTNDIDKTKAADLMELMATGVKFLVFIVKTEKFAKIHRYLPWNRTDPAFYQEVIQMLEENNYIEQVDLQKILDKLSGQPKILPSTNWALTHSNDGQPISRVCGPCKYSVPMDKSDGRQLELHTNRFQCGLSPADMLELGTPCIHANQIDKTDIDFRAHLDYFKKDNTHE